MIRTEDYRKKEDLDESGEQLQKSPDDDKAALDLGGKNPLAEEESVEEDDASGD